MSTGYTMGKGWEIENTSLWVYSVEIFLCWAVKLLLCFEIHSRERPSINMKPFLLCSFLNKILRMISASFAVSRENVLKRFRKRPVHAWLQWYGFILFCFVLWNATSCGTAGERQGLLPWGSSSHTCMGGNWCWKNSSFTGTSHISKERIKISSWGLF